jgi:hypothetical protein
MFFGLNDVGFLAAAAGGAALDPDAAAYIAAVEAADTQALEPAVRTAINDFVVGCKADGTWAAIKASCIMAGARTRPGAMVPLVGAAPTNVGGLFVSGDYNRKTGLVGDGSTKYLDSNRNNNADPQNSNHLAVYATTAQQGATIGAGVSENGSTAISNTTVIRGRSRSSSLATSSLQLTAGFHGINRSSSTTVLVRGNGSLESISQTSQTAFNGNILVFARGTPASPIDYTSSRLAFYSIGESLDLALLDARVTALINAFDAAIP